MIKCSFIAMAGYMSGEAYELPETRTELMEPKLACIEEVGAHKTFCKLRIPLLVLALKMWVLIKYLCINYASVSPSPYLKRSELIN